MRGCAKKDEMSVAKVSEISATSTKSFEAAIVEGIARANKDRTLILGRRLAV